MVIRSLSFMEKGTLSSQFLQNRFNEHLRGYCKEAGVRYLSSHKIRFYGITSLYDAGVETFSPYPKNPLLASFFVNIGRADKKTVFG